MRREDTDLCEIQNARRAWQHDRQVACNPPVASECKGPYGRRRDQVLNAAGGGRGGVVVTGRLPHPELKGREALLATICAIVDDHLRYLG